MGEGKFFTPPINPEKKDQASIQGTSDSTFFFHLMKKINQDKEKVKEISEINSQDERIQAIQEYIDFIIDDSEEKEGARRMGNLSQQEENNKLLIERLHVLKYGDILNPAEMDCAWSYEQVEKVLNRMTGLEIQEDSEHLQNKNSAGGQLYDVFFNEYFYEDELKQLNRSFAAEHVADYINNFISKKNTLSPDEQKKLIYISEFVHNIPVNKKIDLFLALEENSQKMLKETKDRIFESVEELYFIEQVRKNIEQLIIEYKIDVAELVKVIELFKYSCIRLEPDVLGNHVKEETAEALATINNLDNYLIRKKIKTTLNYVFAERGKERLESKNDAILRKDYSNSPIMAEDLYNKAEFKRDSIYEKLSKNYAVIYDPLGQVNCFFELNEEQEDNHPKFNRKDGKIITLAEIVKQEEIPKQFLEKYNVKDITRIYKSLLELPLRREIENDFGIKLEDYSVREQLQFVMFLSSKSEDEVKRIKKFTNAGHSEEGKKDRIRSFLALESEPELGERIVDLGLDPTIDEGARNRIFSAYAELVSQSEKMAEEIIDICGDIFPEKIMDKNEIQAAIMRRSNKIFSEASQAFLMANVDMAINRESWMDNKEMGSNNAERLVRAAFQKQRKNLEDLVEDLKRQERINQKTILSLKKMAEEINAMIEPLALDMGGMVSGETFAEIEPYLSPEQIQEYKRETRFDRKRLEKTISQMEERIRNYNDDFFEGWKLSGKNADSKGMAKMEKIKKAWKKFMLPKEETIKDLKKLLRYVKKLESEIEKIAYGNEQVNSSKDEIPDGEEELKEDKISKKIFRKFDEIIAQAKKSKQEIMRQFKSGEKAKITKEDLDKITNSIIDRADQFLEETTKKIASGKEIDEQEIELIIESYKSDIVTKCSILESLAKEKDLTPEDIKGIEIETVSAKDFAASPRVIEQARRMVSQPEFFSKRDVPAKSMRGKTSEFIEGSDEKEQEKQRMLNRMLEIYADNYEQSSDIEFKNAMAKGLIDAFGSQSENSRFYMISNNKDDVICFLRVEDRPGKPRYLGSFNTVPTAKGSTFGGYLFKFVLEKEGDEDLEATCLPEKWISTKYIESHGFVARGVDHTFKKGGTIMLKILRSQDNSKFKYRDKEKTQEEIIREFEARKNIGNQPEGAVILKFPVGSRDLIQEADKKLNQEHMVLTRYFFAGENKQDAYLVFEKDLA